MTESSLLNHRARATPIVTLGFCRAQFLRNFIAKSLVHDIPRLCFLKFQMLCRMFLAKRSLFDARAFVQHSRRAEDTNEET